jgi:hypothetical protein
VRRRNPAEAGPAPGIGGVVVGVAPRYLVIDTPHGAEWAAVFAVTGYPAEVPDAAWLDPLLSYPGRLDVSVHIEPVDPMSAATRLRRQQARLESGRRHDAEHGRLADPLLDAAAADAHELARQLATAETRLFRVGLYLTVYASTRTGGASLADDVAAVRALAASMLLDAQPATWRQPGGYRACAPVGVDAVCAHRTLDTASIAAMFPFSCPDRAPSDPASPAAAEGVWWGYNLASSSLVHHDRFGPGMHNHNAVVLGRSGSGKSYLIKAEVLRSLYRDVAALIIDPEDEYTRLTLALGGTVIRLGAPGVSLNPLELSIHTGPDGARHAPADALVRQRLFLATVIQMLLGPQNAAERAVLDTAIGATYTRAGITEDPRTWTRPAPTLADLATTLTTRPNRTPRADTTPDATPTTTHNKPPPDEPAVDELAARLAARLRPYVHGGAHAGLFTARPNTTGPDGDGPGAGGGGGGDHLVSYSVRALPEELRPVATLLVLERIWRTVTGPGHRRPRLIVIDEAWMLLGDPGAAHYLYRMAKSARKWWAGLTLATQDTEDVLGTALGRAVVTNAATQVLLRQASQALEQVCSVFGLTQGERAFLDRASQGQGLLCDGADRTAFQSAASPAEDELIRTDPAFLAELATEADPDVITLTPPTRQTAPTNATAPTRGTRPTRAASPGRGTGRGHRDDHRPDRATAPAGPPTTRRTGRDIHHATDNRADGAAGTLPRGWRR